MDGLPPMHSQELSSKPTIAKALFHSPAPRPKVTPASFELSRLKAENQQLKEALAKLRPGTIHVSPDIFTVKNHSVQRKTLTRSVSQKTCSVLLETPSKRPTALVENMVALFSCPRRNAEQYTNSKTFGTDLITIARSAAAVFAEEKRLIHLSSPVYVFGDLHGNLPDLQFFSQNLWSFGLPLTAGNFLFLGDYVDRGHQSLEVVAYLLALKLSCPSKLTMLRGNHELRRVNGWEAWYGAGSFIYQCKARFGDELGTAVWEEVNRAFDNMPLAAVIDNSVFCTHGGIPRPVPVPPSLAVRAPPSAASSVSMASSGLDMSTSSHGTPSSATSYGRSPRTPRTRSSVSMPFSPPDLRLHAIEVAPVPLQLLAIPPRPEALSTPSPSTAPSHGSGGSELVTAEAATRVAMDLMWADPAPETQESSGLDAEGFGVGIRGGDTICFGAQAIDDFLRRNGFQVLVRAHQATATGVGISKSARVVTVFSTSKDHGCGDSATCGCILVEDGAIVPITRSESYRMVPKVAASPPGSPTRATPVKSAAAPAPVMHPPPDPVVKPGKENLTLDSGKKAHRVAPERTTPTTVLASRMAHLKLADGKDSAEAKGLFI